MFGNRRLDNMEQKVCPNNLSPVIKRNPGESVEDHIERVYTTFLPLIKMVCEKAKYNGKRVDIPDYGEPDKYRAFFYHLFQYNRDTKVFNYKRLTMCCLLPMMILNMCDSGCQHCIRKVSTNKKGRETLLCEVFGYLIAFMERSHHYMVFTGYKPDPKQIEKFR